ncbi:deoxyribonuclease-2-alpha-like isoform X2 [Acipenser ruthenus]|uniref:deoxyribonuclease-2-alpha-like isoform X2 n=1 Tax=Acipenser ruthenus TaxID=7906 RepID=UPI00145B15BE|nr:deoxyribonuclease-2-alpha-like isoform X2 [Acipenser ruthenus]
MIMGDWSRSLPCCLCVIACCWLTTCADVSCKNEKGASVDWFILYKLPNDKKGSGLKYLYMDESSNGWIFGKNNINDSGSAVAQTLEPLFKYVERKTEGFGYLLYNDQPPTNKVPASSFGHSKAKQLQYIHIFSFDYAIPQTFPLDLQCVAQRTCYPKKAPWDRKLEMTSLAGSTFVSFAKYARYGDDLYSGLLVEPLGDDLLAKGWGRLHNPLPSNCSVKHNVYNVKSVKLPVIPPFNITSDHSKWCVTMGKKTGIWTCIADMNREISQMRRGGGAVCTSNTAVWKAFSKMVDRYEKCP